MCSWYPHLGLAIGPKAATDTWIVNEFNCEDCYLPIGVLKLGNLDKGMAPKGK